LCTLLYMYMVEDIVVKCGRKRVSTMMMLKLKTHSGFHDLFRFWYVWEYKYGSIPWLEDNNFYFVKTSFSFQILQLFPILENNITCYRICSHLLVFTVYLNVGYTQ
jgi:hypothetical protein